MSYVKFFYKEEMNYVKFFGLRKSENCAKAEVRDKSGNFAFDTISIVM